MQVSPQVAVVLGRVVEDDVAWGGFFEFAGAVLVGGEAQGEVEGQRFGGLDG